MNYSILKSVLAVSALPLAAALAGCAQGGNGSSGGGGGGGGTPTPINGGEVCTAFAPSGSATLVGETGLLCTLTDPLTPLLDTCGVVNPNNVIDNNLTTFAAMDYTVGALDPALGGSVILGVVMPSTISAGQTAAFDVNFPGSVLTALLLGDLTITTFLGSTQQESVGAGQTLALALLGTTIAGPGRGLIGFHNTLPYNAVQLIVNSTVLSANVLNAEVDAYEVCTASVKSTTTPGAGGSPLPAVSPSALCAVPTLGATVVGALGGSCTNGGGGSSPIDPAQLCAVPALGPALASAAGVTCTGGGGGSSPLSLAQLCAIPTVGPQLVAAAGGTCTGVSGGSPLDASQLCAIPTVGPQLAAALGGNCSGGTGSGAPVDVSTLCAIPTLGPAVVSAAGGSCAGGGTGTLDASALCAIPTLGPTLASLAGTPCP